MRHFKKAFISTAIVVLIFALVSYAFLAISAPYLHNEDWQLREELSGSLDFLIVGASQGQCALYTREIDDIIGCNSYNLSSDNAMNYEKNYLLNKEFSRNNIKTVVLELSYNTLYFSGKTKFTNSNVFSILRMDSFSDKMKYFFKKVRLDNKLYVYSELMYNGFFGMLRPQNSLDENFKELKGSKFLPENDHSLSDKEVVEVYNQDTFSLSTFNKNTIKEYTELIKLCQQHGVRVIVAVVPVSDNFIWRTDNLNEFSAWANEYCANNNVEFYDFNLLKERYNLISDADCFSTDIYHMSETGSKVFSKQFANIIQQKAQGKDVSKYFYNSFDELKQDSPYMAIYQAK